MDAIYTELAPLYDVIYGALLHHGRRAAINRLEPVWGEEILELGVGTGLSAVHYPPGCSVTAIDLSAHMLQRAQSRLARRGCTHVRLCQMDAGHLAFADAQFDAVYAPYVLNVVADPVAVLREMLRVCRADGRLVLLNHFEHASIRRHVWSRLAGGLAARISGVDWHLDLERLLTATNLRAVSVEPVNLPPVSAVVVCHKS
jgi:phosphatidylethanolamine/phosphatidyl-N-methylethanolamine N-methyltransferase